MRTERCHERKNDENFAKPNDHAIKLVKNFTKSTEIPVVRRIANNQTMLTI